ncbi:hypothetical protein RHSIM_Rhsim05G0006500 [Rhododendron simsii]|uniref:Uncharacterized protein n=1 Tax=Rhododendron simsii TaxID=118357 RepID=A0A834H1G4_RHOSS|nr:hypothetical protein RHSIM_Rhsim05G0006500 [Rhododendron simsii]
MNRHITLGFQIPAGSFPVFIIIGTGIWIFLYDGIVIPSASKIRGNPFRNGNPNSNSRFPAVKVSSAQVEVQLVKWDSYSFTGSNAVEHRASALCQGKASEERFGLSKSSWIHRK